MRTDGHGRMRFAAPATCLLAAAFTAACGDEADPLDAGLDASTDAGTDTDTGTDTGPYVCTQDELDAQAEAIQAALAEEAPCFTGGVIPWDDMVNAYLRLTLEAVPSLVMCEDSFTNATAEELLEESASLALADMDLLCIGINTDVAGGTAVDVEALRAAIDAVTEAEDPEPDPDAGADAGADAGTDGGTGAPCAVEGLDDPLFVVDIDEEGAVQNIHAADADTSPETAEYVTCLQAELVGLSLPCLATMQICSVYP
jgi:hypothetical protein